MAESKQGKKKYKREQLTPEQQAELAALRAKNEAEQKAEAERIQQYGKTVEKMTDRQLRSELKRVIRKEHSGRPPVPQAGLTIAFGTILLTVLENTKSKSNPFGKLLHVLNPLPLQNHTKATR